MSVIVTKNGLEARPLEPSRIPQETFLQEYIVSNPEVLPLSDLREDLSFVIVAREFPTASGPIDAVGLDDEGNLYLIETKLYRNADKRRVLAQVLDYGAALWKRHGDSRAFREELEESARLTLERELDDKICESFAIDAARAEEVLATAEKQVSEGRFRFVVLMDRLDDRLRDLIGFINENSRFDVFGVELKFYKFDDYEIAIPKLYGAEVRKEVESGSARRRWDEASYFEDVERRHPPDKVTAFRRLYDFAIGHADRVTWGTGRIHATFSLKYDRIHPSKSLLTLYSEGRLDLNFSWLHASDQPLPEEAQKFSELVDQLDGWSLPDNYATSYPHLGFEVWAPQVDKLIEALKLSIDSETA